MCEACNDPILEFRELRGYARNFRKRERDRERETERERDRDLVHIDACTWYHHMIPESSGERQRQHPAALKQSLSIKSTS